MVCVPDEIMAAPVDPASPTRGGQQPSVVEVVGAALLHPALLGEGKPVFGRLLSSSGCGWGAVDNECEAYIHMCM